MDRNVLIADTEERLAGRGRDSRSGINKFLKRPTDWDKKEATYLILGGFIRRKSVLSSRAKILRVIAKSRFKRGGNAAHINAGRGELKESQKRGGASKAVATRLRTKKKIGLQPGTHGRTNAGRLEKNKKGKHQCDKVVGKLGE